MTWFQNTKQQGNVGLGAAIAYFTSIGITVAIPLNDSQDYDLIIERDGKLLKVSVKTTSEKAPSGHYIAKINRRGGTNRQSKPFNKNSSDLLFILTASHEKYCIPTFNISNVSCITLNNSQSQYIVR